MKFKKLDWHDLSPSQWWDGSSFWFTIKHNLKVRKKSFLNLPFLRRLMLKWNSVSLCSVFTIFYGNLYPILFWLHYNTMKRFILTSNFPLYHIGSCRKKAQRLWNNENICKNKLSRRFSNVLFLFWRFLCYALLTWHFFFGQIVLFSMTNDLNVKRNKLIILLNKFS
jgi:hypothetical protein